MSKICFMVKESNVVAKLNLILLIYVDGVHYTTKQSATAGIFIRKKKKKNTELTLPSWGNEFPWQRYSLSECFLVPMHVQFLLLLLHIHVFAIVA